MVDVPTGTDVWAWVSVGTGALVQMEVLVGASGRTSVAVHVGEGVAEARVSGRGIAPVIKKETQAMDTKTRIIDSPK